MTTRIHSPSGVRVVGPGQPLDMLLTVIPSLPRPVLARLTTHMIERMDELDGDTDLEAEQDFCLAGDDGCGPVYRDGKQYWGSKDAGASPHIPKPIYGDDQSKGPINEEAAWREYHCTMERLGWPE